MVAGLLMRRIAVLPLDNFTGDPEQEHVVQGLHEAITFRLGRIRSLDVISQTSVVGYRGTHSTAKEIGQELGVGSILEGPVTAQGDSVRIILRSSGRFREALVEADQALQLDSTVSSSRSVHGAILTHLGRFDEGIAELRRAQDSVPLALGLMRAGRRDGALAIRDALTAPARPRGISAFDLVRFCTLAGEVDEAVGYLEQADQERAGNLMWLSVEPDLEELRHDARVQALLQRMRLPDRAG